MTKLRVGLLLFIVLISACENKSPQGFGLEGASIRYQTKSFEDPETLAVVNGQVFTKSQILDKSPVLKDLALQEQAAKAANQTGNAEAGTGNQGNPADAAKDGEVVDAEFAEAK